MEWLTQIKELFAAAEQSSSQNPVIHELLTRHKGDNPQLELWHEGQIRKSLSAWLSHEYQLFLAVGATHDEAIDFLNSPGLQGFVIHFSRLQYSLEEAECFQLFLRKRVLDCSNYLDHIPKYSTHVADSKTFSPSDGTIRLDRYILKPRSKFYIEAQGCNTPDSHTKDQFDQGFGQILIELRVLNHQPAQLKLSTASYQDRVYKKVSSFTLLMDLFTD